MVLRSDACQAANMVSAPNPGLRQRTRMACTKTAAAPNPLYQTREWKKDPPQLPRKIVTDVCDLSFKRIPGARIKHRVKQNWLKMYDKASSILRLEMVINEPERFKVLKQVTRNGRKVMKWVDMRKGVAYLFRYRDVSLAANRRYLTHPRHRCFSREKGL